MKTETIKTQMDTYDMVQHPEGMCSTRNAKITFSDGVFHGCKFNTLYPNDYDYDDWMFIKEVALKIEELQKTYNK